LFDGNNSDFFRSADVRKRAAVRHASRNADL